MQRVRAWPPTRRPLSVDQYVVRAHPAPAFSQQLGLYNGDVTCPRNCPSFPFRRGNYLCFVDAHTAYAHGVLGVPPDGRWCVTIVVCIILPCGSRDGDKSCRFVILMRKRQVERPKTSSSRITARTRRTPCSLDETLFSVNVACTIRRIVTLRRRVRADVRKRGRNGIKTKIWFITIV